MPAFESERNGAVATLWLANPERRNAMGPAFFQELPGFVEQLDNDPSVRAIVLAARGEHFSSGLDLKSDIGLQIQATLAGGLASEREKLLKLIKDLQQSFDRVARCTKPILAAIHGACIGGGLDLIAACDLRFASANTLLSLRETRLAIVADLGSLQRLATIIGQGHLRDLALTGRDVTAPEAERMGLLNAVLPDAATTVAHAQNVAAQIAANSPLTVRGVKAVLHAAQAQSISHGLDHVALWNAAFLPSDDLVEAVSSFIQKRPPEFRGR